MPTGVEIVALRPWDLADASLLWAEAMADADAEGAAPTSWAEALSRACLTDPMTTWRTVRNGSDGTLVGAVGIQPATDLPNTFEMCWWTVPSYRQRGCGKAAVTRMIADVRPRMGSSELVAVIRPDNVPSIQLAQSCGFVADSSVALKRGLLHRMP